MGTYLRHVKVSPTIRRFCNDTELSTDFLHASSVPSLISMPEHAHYGYCYAADNLKHPAPEEALRKIMCCSFIRGFHVAIMLLDAQLKAAKYSIKLGVTTNLASKGDHTRKIECFIGLSKKGRGAIMLCCHLMHF